MAYCSDLLNTALLTAVVLAITGCSSGNDFNAGSTERLTKVTMNVLSIIYGEYLDTHNGNPPKDIAEFRKYLESNAEDLKRYNVESLDQLLVSPRDGKPFVLICGKRSAPSDLPDMPWAAYEQNGIEGKRMAVQVRGGVHELTAEEIEKIGTQQ
jgi:hypothetical protein